MAPVYAVCLKCGFGTKSSLNTSKPVNFPNECMPCVPGEPCEVCEPGEGVSGGACAPCAKGSFSADAYGVCSPCPPDTYSPTTGARHCLDCALLGEYYQVRRTVLIYSICPEPPSLIPSHVL